MFDLFQFMSLLPDSLICLSNRPKATIAVVIASIIVATAVITMRNDSPKHTTEPVKERRITKIVGYLMQEE